MINALYLGDTVQVREGFVKDKIGDVIRDDEKGKHKERDIYKIDFGDGWVGWHKRSNLRIIRRNRRKNREFA